MAFIILLDAVAGIMVSLIYYPGSPLYIFHHVQFEEVWLWSKYSAVAAALLFTFAILSIDSDHRSRDLARSLSAFVATLQGILNIPPAITYIVFLRGSAMANITARENTITISYWELILHLVVIAISWTVAIWLVRGNKKRESAEDLQLVDMQA